MTLKDMKIIQSIAYMTMLLSVCAGARAQVNQFTGLHLTGGIGYQNLHYIKKNIIDQSNTSNNLTFDSDRSVGIDGRVGIDFTMGINPYNTLSIGVDYKIGRGQSKEGIYFSNGVYSEGVRYKPEQIFALSISPGVMVNKNMLAYLKIGIGKNAAEITNSTVSAGGRYKSESYNYGVGARVLNSRNTFLFSEINLISEKCTPQNSNNGMSTWKDGIGGYDIVIGIGRKF